MPRRALSVGACALLLAGCPDRHQAPGTISPQRLPDAVVADRASRQAEVSKGAKQILFGDLHVHTTYSADAFIASLPMLQGEGVHPPADACDFARYCSSLDFWSINDHAEALTPRYWQEIKDTIRQCNAVAGDPKNPDVVAFLGWEWTQVGQTPSDHYGHKNVIFKDLDEDKVPVRPVSALSPRLLGALVVPQPFWQRLQFPIYDWANRDRYLDFGAYQDERRAVPLCPAGVDVRQLPPDCHEKAETPRELFEKLSQWGFDTLVIPHGTTWGFYTPPGTTFAKQLSTIEHDPEKQTLFEIYSGHGNSEDYRTWKAIDWDAEGNAVCPMPEKNYEPCCWRAGEIIRARCGDASSEECDRRVADARKNYLGASVVSRRTIPGTTAEDWKDCGQCRDCFAPSFNLVPGNAAQFALAVTNFDDPEQLLRFRFGFLASSDNHSARPGTGYKEFARHRMTESAGARDQSWRERIFGKEPPPSAVSVPFDFDSVPPFQAFQILDIERQGSFFFTGGLVALHSEGRDRDSVWDALKRREVYGTSGERILLWFDLLNAAGGPKPMGSEVVLDAPPTFRVRAAGSFQQKPGCPEASVAALAPERLQRLCQGECYNPGDERYRITRIEVVRIRPQVRPDEPIGSLIEDPWRKLPCKSDPAGCTVEFGDPDFVAGKREAIYYVRAIQEPTPAVNAASLRCEYDAQGNCVKVNPCYGDYRTAFDDDCLAPNEERAWSSPIYVRGR